MYVFVVIVMFLTIWLSILYHTFYFIEGFLYIIHKLFHVFFDKQISNTILIHCAPVHLSDPHPAS